ncbi:putative quinol monooxygenase [Shewanella zhangzhouensis]|uniref:putative quinol monooxygenase n=1 Tax=Shewanella zhangzhouensis TaxID=2864213 RepID=UPI001C657F75|nr:antibiotic biosynthesis monooxygenase [Shewanella zhangzhouensis]
MIHVIATISVKPGNKIKVLSELLRIQPLVLAERGCHQYEPLLDVDSRLSRQETFRADTIVLLEQWESLEDLKVHLDTPHLKEYQELVSPYIQDVSLQILQKAN